MADEAEEPAEDGEEDAPKKKGKGMLFGIIGAVVLGGVGFFLTFSGMLFGGGEEPAEEPKKMATASSLPTFVPIDPLVISLGADASSRHLKFAAELEIDPEYQEEVTTLMPRILDILNTFLRAVEDSDIESPTSMTRLRAQMLRRVQVVTGEGRVKDLLITEFVLN